MVVMCVTVAKRLYTAEYSVFSVDLRHWWAEEWTSVH